MEIKDGVRSILRTAEFTVDRFLQDMTDEELLVRPVPGANHIAWQLGHLIHSERGLVEISLPGFMRPLPEEFAAKYSRTSHEFSSSDRREDFLSKAEYLQIKRDVREQTLQAIEQIPLSELDRPVEKVPKFLHNVGDCLFFIGSHWLMHAGQWAVIRRKLGRPPLI